MMPQYVYSCRFSTSKWYLHMNLVVYPANVQLQDVSLSIMEGMDNTQGADLSW